jgi:hypothetical protein
MPDAGLDKRTQGLRGWKRETPAGTDDEHLRCLRFDFVKMSG